MFKRTIFVILSLFLCVQLWAQSSDQTQAPEQSPPDQGQSVPQSPPPDQSQQPNTQVQSGVGTPINREVQGQAQDAGAQPAVEVEPQRVPGPLPINGSANSLAFTSELERSNYIRGGVSVVANYDDNALNQTTNPVGDFSYSILPHIALDQSRARTHWTLDYAAGLVVNQRLTARNQGSHSLLGELTYRTSPHSTLRLRDVFSLTTSFFNQFQSNFGIPGTGSLQQPNQSIITPISKQLNNLGSAEFNWQFSASDMVGGSGTFYLSHFRDLPPGTTVSLVDTRTEEADGFYTHRFTPRNWTGIAYKFQRLSFSPGADKANTQSFLLFHTIYLRPRMTLSFFAGPEYSTLDSQVVTTVLDLPLLTLVSTPVSENRWTVSGGASYSWQGELTSVQISGSRKITDGGGLLSVVELNTGSAALRRQLRRTTVFDVGVIYGDNRAVGDFFTGPARVKSVSGSLGLEQRLRANFVLSLGYSRDYQQQSANLPPALDVNHNRGWVAISYDFVKAIGR